MVKKRKTYYLEEDTILKVKNYARKKKISENEAFESAIHVYEKFHEDAERFLAIPKKYSPIILEAIDNMIYQSKQLLEASWLSSEDQQTLNSSLSSRIEQLMNIRKILDK